MADHFYNPIPVLDKYDDSFWTRRKMTPGLDFRIEGQLRLIETLKQYRDEFKVFGLHKTSGMPPHEYVLNNGSFEQIDGEIYYSFIRHFKPKRIIEIGSGWSTKVAARACLSNIASGHEVVLTAIEPYPSVALREGFPGLHSFVLIDQKVESVPIERFAQLEAGDILFIDSSHVVRTGGDVLKEYLEIIPQLKTGVLVHVHDICLPYEYPKEWIFGSEFYWTEQYLLQAFLAFNDSFQILFSGNLLHKEYKPILKEFSYSYDEENWPGSFWFTRVK